jgi:hypothetical protein
VHEQKLKRYVTLEINKELMQLIKRKLRLKQQEMLREQEHYKFKQQLGLKIYQEEKLNNSNKPLKIKVENLHRAEVMLEIQEVVAEQ